MISSIRYKVVLDTNVFISGAVYGGNAGIILKYIEDDKFDLLISKTTSNELFGKLHNLKISLTTIRSLEKLLLFHGKTFTPKKRIRICRDPKDNMFLELCLEAKADYLITGDRDLLDLKSFKKTIILTPKQFLAISSGTKTTKSA